MATSTLKSIPTCGDVIRLINNNVISTPSPSEMYLCDNNGILIPYNNDSSIVLNKSQIFGIAVVSNSNQKIRFVIGRSNISCIEWTNNPQLIKSLTIDVNDGIGNTENMINYDISDNAFKRCYNDTSYFGDSIHGYMPSKEEIEYAMNKGSNLMYALNLLSSDAVSNVWLMSSTLYSGTEFYTLFISNSDGRISIGHKNYNNSDGCTLRAFFPVIL